MADYALHVRQGGGQSWDAKETTFDCGVATVGAGMATVGAFNRKCPPIATTRQRYRHPISYYRRHQHSPPHTG
ncbi:hypothetical protein CCP3SC15_530020 [Gammaproteobacteria bacterium]